jgi:hypothetical protein
MVDFETHIKGNKLDLILTNCPEKVISVTDEGRLGRSDHVMLMLKIDTNAAVKQSSKEIICWKRGRYDKIRNNLELIDWRNELTNKTTEEAWATFKQVLSHQVETEIPSFIPNGKRRPQWLTSEIKSLLTTKKRHGGGRKRTGLQKAGQNMRK